MAPELGARWLPVLGAHPGQPVGFGVVRAGSFFFLVRTRPVGWLGWGEASTLTPAISAFSLPFALPEKKMGA